MALRYKRLLRGSRVVAALVTLTGWAFYTQAPAADAKHQWQTLNSEVRKAFQTGNYAEGVPLAEKALEVARQRFGGRDPDTLTRLHKLALLYPAQGRFGAAEP